MRFIFSIVLKLIGVLCDTDVVAQYISVIHQMLIHFAILLHQTAVAETSMAMATTTRLALSSPCHFSSSSRPTPAHPSSRFVPWKSPPSNFTHYRLGCLFSCRGGAGQQLRRGVDSSVRAAQSSAKNEGVTNVVDEDNTRQRLRELSESLVLPASYLEKLPNDLRVDLKDAAFALASGALDKECGEQAGEMLMQLSRTWERGDTQAVSVVASQLPSLLDTMASESSCVAVGKRMTRAGRHFAATGKYENGELQKIGKALIAAGEAVSGGNLPINQDPPISTTKTFKFGDLQVDITSQRAYIGAGIAVAFGLLSWKLTQGLQTVSESSMEYANDNAILLATSLRGTLLALGYACSILSACTMVGLMVLATRLDANKK